MIQEIPSVAVKNNIVYKLGNEIITSFDVNEQFKYLLAFNLNLKQIEEREQFKISLSSLIQEKIKKIELLNTYKNLKIDDEYKKKLITRTYTMLGHSNILDFKNYLETYNLKIEDIEEKITVEALWNEIIIKKFSKEIKINTIELKKRIESSSNVKNKSYLLSEIFIEIKRKDQIEINYNKILKSIEDVGFENTASIYSISDSSKFGGSIGWVEEKSLSKTLKLKLSSLKKLGLSDFIALPGGFLILKINDIKFENKKTNKENELQKLIDVETRKQLSQYSKIYYSKLKKRIVNDE